MVATIAHVSLDSHGMEQSAPKVCAYYLIWFLSETHDVGFIKTHILEIMPF